MKDKLKEKIDILKEDKLCYKEYIKAFCDIEKVEELYKDDTEYEKLKREIKEKREY